MATRNNVQDAMAAIRSVAPKSGNVYGASLNADGSIQVTKNQVPLPYKVWWSTSTAHSRTDATQGDPCTIANLDGSSHRTGDFNNFLLSLT
jgi:hypothetical protein